MGPVSLRPKHIGVLVGWLYWLGVVMVMTVVNSPSVRGQALPPVFDPTLRSGEPPAPLRKEFKPPPTPPPSPVLPPISPVPEGEVEKRFPGVRVFVHDIHVIGSTVFSDEDIDRVIAPFRGRTITTQDLERLRLALTLLYVSGGYITSGAIIPDQDVTFGVITVQIIEGELTSIEVEGTNWFRPAYLQDRIALGIRTPVTMGPLQERLQFLQQDPRIERVNAELRPGAQRGESLLHVKVTEASPFKGWLEFNNFQTPVVGAERGLATVAHRNLTGHGDPLSFAYGRSSGVNPIIDSAYQLPLNAYETTLTASYRRNDFLVIEAPFRPLDIKAQAEIISFTLRQPIVKTLSQEFALAVTGEYLYNKIESAIPELSGGGPDFQFIAGLSPTGVGNVSALRFVQEWVSRSETRVLAARSRFTVGLDLLDATIRSGPDRTVAGRAIATGRFFAWLGQMQAVQRLDRWWGLQLLGRFDAQLANDHLFPLEQVPVGGRFSVRGYRENSLIRDNAILTSLEARLPLLRWASGEDMLQLAPFVDYGSGWNNNESTPFPRFLASVGAGLRWSILPKDRAHFEVYWGQQLNHFRTGEGNMQDHGVHLQLVAEVF